MAAHLIAVGRPVRLSECPSGLFLFDGSLHLKTEYPTEAGQVDVYCGDSGEVFWGGTTAFVDRAALVVTPVRWVDRTEVMTMAQKKYDVRLVVREWARRKGDDRKRPGKIVQVIGRYSDAELARHAQATANATLQACHLDDCYVGVLEPIKR